MKTLFLWLTLSGTLSWHICWVWNVWTDISWWGWLQEQWFWWRWLTCFWWDVVPEINFIRHFALKHFLSVRSLTWHFMIKSISRTMCLLLQGPMVFWTCCSCDQLYQECCLEALFECEMLEDKVPDKVNHRNNMFDEHGQVAFDEMLFLRLTLSGTLSWSMFRVWEVWPDISW